MKKIKAIKIDTVLKSIYEIEITPELQSYYKEMNCDLIEVGCRVFPTAFNTDEIIQQSILADVLYVDEEGSYKQNNSFIFCTGYGLNSIYNVVFCCKILFHYYTILLYTL